MGIFIILHWGRNLCLKIATVTGTLAFSLSACDEKKEVAKTVSNNTKEEQSSAKKKIRRMKIQREYNVEKTTQIRNQKLTVHKVQIAQVAEYDKLEKVMSLLLFMLQ